MSKRQTWLALAAGIVLAATVGACAKPDSEGVASAGGQAVADQTDPNAPSNDPEERVRQFVACMRAEGIDVPDPEPGDVSGKSALRFAVEGVDKAKLGAAMEKCNEYMPEGGQREPLTPEQVEGMRAFAQCMRAEGIDWPDPNADGTFPEGTASQLRKDDPPTRAALEKCQAHVRPPSPAAGQG